MKLNIGMEMIKKHSRNDQENTAVESKPGSPCHGDGPGRENGVSSTRPIFLFLDSNIFSLMSTRKFTSGVCHLKNSPSEGARKQFYVTKVASKLTQISHFILCLLSYPMRQLMSCYTEFIGNSFPIIAHYGPKHMDGF